MIDETVAHYKITEKLGEGGMGVVYKAEDTKLKRPVALKFLSPSLTRSPEAKARFLREAQAASALDHPNICTVHEINEDSGETFIAMAFVEGRTLKDVISSGELDPAGAVELILQAVEGLRAAHAKGIIHRDIKPANMMVTSDGQLKIMDFGLAATSGEDTRLTKTGTTMGTVSYMSPEQAKGEEIDERSDLWSLGVVLYEMLAGRRPFRGDRDATILYALVNEDPPALGEIQRDLPPELERVVSRALAKEPAQRFPNAESFLEELNALRRQLRGETVAPSGGGNGFGRKVRKPTVIVPAVLVVAAVGFFTVQQSRSAAEVRWAQEEAIPEIRRLVEEGLDEGVWTASLEAFELAQRAEAIVPDDPALAELWPRVASHCTIVTEPPGADVFIREYSSLDAEWKRIGQTPLDSLLLPDAWFRWRFEMPGYETVLAAASTSGDEIRRVLTPVGEMPEGMVRVPEHDLGDWEYGGLFPAFLMDRYEVSNREFKKFVDDGGYRNRDLWKFPFTHEGRTLTWEEAMDEFRDVTGRPGPSTWEGGDFPDGRENYPVSGVSWYEAAAYAEWIGKELPSVGHWELAAGGDFGFRQIGQRILPQSNIDGREAAAPIGEHPGMTFFGLFDMAGNVREWNFEESPVGRCTRGGAWDDVSYMFSNVSQLPAMNRSPKNGFRCVVNLHPESLPEWAHEPLEQPERDYYAMTPVSDEVFEVYRSRFAYDKSALDPTVDFRDDSHEDYVHETVSFNAAYGNERMIVQMLIPKNGTPPYQSLVMFPGSNAVYTPEFNGFGRWFYKTVINSNRAWVLPIWRGTYERNIEGFTLEMHSPTEEHQHTYTDYMIKWGQDLGRTIDYFDSRPDLDAEGVSFIGFSWGAKVGPVLTAVEPRLAASVLVVGGLGADDFPLPEADPFHYAPRVRVPTLLLNGKYDMVFGYDLEVKPLFELLPGVEGEDKKIVLYETDHTIPRNALAREALEWVDLHAGPTQ